MAPVRFGIIACSSVARRRFLPALGTSTIARLERIGSRDPARAGEFAREFSCAKHGDYEAVLTDPEVDAVYISTPPSLHLEWVRRATAAGKHVLCEKRAFGQYRAAVEAVERCRAARVRLMEGYSFKFHPQHAALRSLITSQHIGAPRLFRAEFTYPRPPEGDIRLKPDLDGGVFHDSAGYPVAAALLHLPGQPTSVFCQTVLDTTTGVDSAFSLELRFSGGEIAQLFAGFGLHYSSTYAVLGTRGQVRLERAFAVPPPMKTTVVLETEAGAEKISVEPADQFRLMIDAFSAKLSAVTAPGPDLETDLLRQHAVMDAAGRSSREGRAIDLSEYR